MFGDISIRGSTVVPITPSSTLSSTTYFHPYHVSCSHLQAVICGQKNCFACLSATCVRSGLGCLRVHFELHAVDYFAFLQPCSLGNPWQDAILLFLCASAKGQGRSRRRPRIRVAAQPPPYAVTQACCQLS